MPSTKPHFIDVAPLARLMGSTLKQVHYWCLKHEANEEDIAHPEFFLGGVVKLTFDNQVLYATWAKEAGQPITSGLTLLNTCTWDAEYYTALDASATPYWQPLIGRRLVQADLMGWRGIVSVAAFSFEENVVYIGTGNKFVFGYGDDVLIRSQETFWLSPHVQDLEMLHCVRMKAFNREVLVA